MRLASIILVLALGSGAACGSEELLIEPDAGLAPVYELLQSATRSVDMTMYELSDPAAEQLLAQAAARGVVVRVILDANRERKRNAAAFAYLLAHGVSVRWAGPGYRATHEKAFVVDGSVAAILTLNLTARYYRNTRDFGVVDRDPEDIAAIESVFEADFGGQATTAPPGSALVWSPGQSNTELLMLIHSARETLWAENEEMSDRDIVNALKNDAARGVVVRIVMNNDTSYTKEWQELSDAGAQVVTGGPLYIHAKVILVDYGTPEARAFEGSENFSYASLRENRELGLVFTDPSMIESLQAALAADFNNGKPWP